MNELFHSLRRFPVVTFKNTTDTQKAVGTWAQLPVLAVLMHPYPEPLAALGGCAILEKEAQQKTLSSYCNCTTRSSLSVSS